MTTSMYKSLALGLRGRMYLGEVKNAKIDSDLAKIYKSHITKLPALLVVGMDGAVIPYAGKLSHMALSSFLEKFSVGKPKGGTGKKILPGTVTHLAEQSDFDAACANKPGICVVGLLDADKSDAHVAILQELAENNRQNPYHFMWMDAKKNKDFAAAVYAADKELPQAVLLAPKKRRFANHIGQFTTQGIKEWIHAILGGRIKTSAFEKDLPPIKG